MNENYTQYIEQISTLDLEELPAGFLQALGFYCFELAEIKANEINGIVTNEINIKRYSAECIQKAYEEGYCDGKEVGWIECESKYT